MAFPARRALALVATVAVSLFCLAGQALAQSEYGIRLATSKTIKGVYTIEANVPDLTAKEWIVVLPARRRSCRARQTLARASCPAATPTRI